MRKEAEVNILNLRKLRAPVGSSMPPSPAVPMQGPASTTAMAMEGEPKIPSSLTSSSGPIILDLEWASAKEDLSGVYRIILATHGISQLRISVATLVVDLRYFDGFCDRAFASHDSLNSIK